MPPSLATELAGCRDPAELGCLPRLAASLFLLPHTGSLQHLFETCQPPFPLPCLHWITFTILLALMCSLVTDSLDSPTGDETPSTGKWKRTLFPSLAEWQELLFLNFKGISQPLSPNMSPPSCSWCKDLSDLTGEMKFQLYLASKRRTHSGEGEDWVLMMVEAVSVGPGLNMEGKEDTGQNPKEWLLFRGKCRWAWELCCTRAVADCSGFLVLDVMILFQLSKGVSSPKQREVQPSGLGCWKS